MIEQALILQEELEGVREEAENEKGKADAEIVKLRQTNKLLLEQAALGCT